MSFVFSPLQFLGLTPFAAIHTLYVVSVPLFFSMGLCPALKRKGR